MLVPAFVVAWLLLLFGANAQCAHTKTISAPSSLASATTLHVSLLSGSTLVVQAKAGSEWGFEFHGSDADAVAKLNLEFSAVTASGSFTATVTGAGGEPASNEASFAMRSTGAPSALFLAFTLLFGALVAQRRRGQSGLTASVVVIVFVVVGSVSLCTAAVVYFCNSNTLVVTYPPGASIFVRNKRMPTCSATASSPAAVQAPVLKYARQYMGTFWFASAIVADLDNDHNCKSHCNEVIVCSESCRVFNSSLDNVKTLSTSGRVYAAHVLADVDGDGKPDLCAASSRTVYCWKWNSNQKKFDPRTGFPLALPGISSGEIRGMAAADLDRDGADEIILTTTNSKVQTFVVRGDGTAMLGWPRYNTGTGPLDDADPNSGVEGGRNGMGHYRYGGYGFNVGVGNIDDDPYPELVTTYDDHQIQAFKRNGVALNAAANFTNMRSKFRGNPLTYGQMTARWTNRTTDENHFIKHGCWPFVSRAHDPCYDAVPCVAGGDEWLQFTQVPASIVDLDLDGKNEIVTVPNSEKGFNDNCDSYVTQNRVLFVLDGAYGNSGDPTKQTARAAMRHPGFDNEWPPKGRTITCQSCVNSACTCRNEKWYPPESIPSVAWGDISGTDGRPELVFSFGDGAVYAYSNTGAQLWMFDFAALVGVNRQANASECSEPVLADLNQDGVPEVIFSVYGWPVKPPSRSNNQRLIILSNTGTLLHDVLLNTAAAGGGDTSFNGNGNGAAAAPTIADIDGDGQLEILLGTFDGRVLVYTVPGSASNCILWPTARGGWLRKGQPDYAPNP